MWAKGSAASATLSPRRFHAVPAGPLPCFWRDPGSCRVWMAVRLAAPPSFPAARALRPMAAPGARRRSVGPVPPSDERGWFASLGDAASYRLSGCLDAVFEVELGEDRGDVV